MQRCCQLSPPSPISSVILLLPLLLMLLSPFLFGPIKCQDEPDGDSGGSDPQGIYSEEKWSFVKSEKLRFNFSDNFYAMSTVNYAYAPSSLVPPTKIFYGELFEDKDRKHLKQKPNIDIEFLVDPDDETLMCRYRVHMNALTLGEYSEIGGNVEFEDGGLKEMENGTWSDTNDALWYRKKYLEEVGTVCSETGNNGGCIKMWTEEDPGVYGVWMDGGGTFNEEMEDPHCLYDFYRIAMERSEYELFRYCAKAYFYRGYDYNDPRARFMREGWNLYIMEGTIFCKMSDDKEKQQMGNDMLGLGFQMDMYQQYACGEYQLSQFKDDDRLGKFMLAGITGSANIPCNRGAQAPGEERKLTLKVGHYCTKAKEYDRLTFNLNFKPEELANSARGVQEDMHVQVHPFWGALKFSTDFILCAVEKPDCKKDKEIYRALDVKNPPKEAEEQKPADAEVERKKREHKRASHAQFLNGTMEGSDNNGTASAEGFFNSTAMGSSPHLEIAGDESNSNSSTNDLINEQSINEQSQPKLGENMNGNSVNVTLTD